VTTVVCHDCNNRFRRFSEVQPNYAAPACTSMGVPLITTATRHNPAIGIMSVMPRSA
jgi:hypothetical protein